MMPLYADIFCALFIFTTFEARFDVSPLMFFMLSFHFFISICA